ncbi:MAG: tryptophan--tRNA ligase [Patescibacteria group bacterium]
MSENMKRVLTGIRPTGPLHLGHYVGALKQCVLLQDEYECFFMIADVQALTTHAGNPKVIEESVRDVLLDFLAVGLDPTKPNVHFILQSAIPELAELTVYLSMVTPFTWMQSNPTIQQESKALGKGISTGFMCYPVSQAADILFVSPDPTESKEEILVPVGEDQVPHLRDTNSIVSAFNRTYSPTFNECKPLLGDYPRFVGTDGQLKMSKSLGNCINLGDDEKTVEKMVKGMFTDPNRIHPNDPGTVEGNPVFIYHDIFNPDKKEVCDLKKRYKDGTVGDVEVKEKLNVAIQSFLKPIRERRKHAEKMDIKKFLEDGTDFARGLAVKTLSRTRKAMHLDYPSLK